ncbi:1944_t:CDS:2, partial [Cetraspora pellucida]
MDLQQPINFKTSFNILKDDNLLTFDNNYLSKNYYTSANSPLPSKNNQTNNGRQAQAQDPDILELILQKITARFKEVTVEVTAAAKLPVHKTNLSLKCKIKIASSYLCGITTSWSDEVKDNLVYWNRETHPDEEGLKAKTAAWLSIADLNSLENAIQDAHKIKAKEYYNKKDGRDKAYNRE